MPAERCEKHAQIYPRVADTTYALWARDGHFTLCLICHARGVGRCLLRTVGPLDEMLEERVLA